MAHVLHDKGYKVMVLDGDASNPGGLARLMFGLKVGDPLTATVSPEQVEAASRALKETGVLFADVGRVREGIGVRVLRDTGTVHHTEIRCEEDELARMWALYPRGG